MRFENSMYTLYLYYDHFWVNNTLCILIISLFKGFCRNFDLKKHTRRLHDGGVGEDETEAAAGLSLEATANLALEASNHVNSLVGHAVEAVTNIPFSSSSAISNLASDSDSPLPSPVSVNKIIILKTLTIIDYL